MRRFAAGVATQAILREAAEVLGRHHVDVIPLKGAFFQRVLYADPSERFSSDVDLLVLPHDFDRAVAALLSGGFRYQKVGRSMIEASFSSPRGLAVDLHSQLFGEGRFGLSTREVFARARRDEDTFGVPLLVADPYDMAAHLIGKLVTDHVSADPERRLKELLLLVERYGLEPGPLARRLTETGLERAARYALHVGAVGRPDPAFFEAALQALPPDPLGVACAWVARQTLKRTSSKTLGSVVAHSLNQSLPHGAVSAGLAAVNRLRHARLERARRRHARQAHGGNAHGGHWLPFRVAGAAGSSGGPPLARDGAQANTHIRDTVHPEPPGPVPTSSKPTRGRCDPG